jgi:hypothetical protein
VGAVTLTSTAFTSSAMSNSSDNPTITTTNEIDPTVSKTW